MVMPMTRMIDLQNHRAGALHSPRLVADHEEGVGGLHGAAGEGGEGAGDCLVGIVCGGLGGR